FTDTTGCACDKRNLAFKHSHSGVFLSYRAVVDEHRFCKHCAKNDRRSLLPKKRSLQQSQRKASLNLSGGKCKRLRFAGFRRARAAMLNKPGDQYPKQGREFTQLQYIDRCLEWCSQ
ncbi:MAG: hypothetical protein M3R24_22405, partial [Chloroflexota bacterium]|nr:hypothetical protein [Chloroflexota bacterium]